MSKLNKSLQQIRTEGDRFTLKQQAEQEFQQVEGCMFHYHSLWLNSLFPRVTSSNGRLEVGVDAIQNQSLSQNTELSLADNNYLPVKFLNYLDNLQRQLKPLLQGGMLLFHPDHLLNLTHTQAMKALITRYSQTYLEQSRCYLDSLKNYHLCIEEFYLLDPQKLQRQQLLRECSDLARRVQELAHSIKELKQSFEDFAKELKEVEAKRAKDKEIMEV